MLVIFTKLLWSSQATGLFIGHTEKNSCLFNMKDGNIFITLICLPNHIGVPSAGVLHRPEISTLQLGGKGATLLHCPNRSTLSHSIHVHRPPEGLTSSHGPLQVTNKQASQSSHGHQGTWIRKWDCVVLVQEPRIHKFIFNANVVLQLHPRTTEQAEHIFLPSLSPVYRSLLPFKGNIHSWPFTQFDGAERDEAWLQHGCVLRAGSTSSQTARPIYRRAQ